MQTFLQDTLYAIRVLLKNPGFSAVAVLTLALGIGATTAIFSVVHAVMLRPFPFQEPDRLVVVWERQLQIGLPYMFASPPNFADWREQNQVFDEMAAFDVRGFFLKQEEEPTRIVGSRVTASLLSVLKVAPMLGRDFSKDDDQTGKERVVILGYGLWRDRFGADPDILGKSIILNEEEYTVIGVMPPEFKFPPPINLEGGTPDPQTQLWMPFALDMKAGQRGAHFMTVIARLNPGVALEQADSEMNALARRLEEDYPATNKGWDITIVPLTQQVLGETGPALLALMAAVGFVLLIACANLANLLIARGAARQKEFAIRSALGAGPGRLMRQLLTESLLLALIGGMVGLLLAYLGVGILIGLAPQGVPRLEEVAIDGQVVLFTIGISILTGLLFGLAPALQSYSVNLNQWLKEGGRTGATGAGRTRFRHALVISEVALSLVLLVGAGLLFQSFLRLQGIESGFKPENVLTLRLSLPQAKYPEVADWIVAYEELERRIDTIPAIESAGLVYDIPLAADRQGSSIVIEGEPPAEPGRDKTVNFTFVTPGYFNSMRIPLLRGRNFEQQDGKGNPEVIIVNDTLARQFFPNEDPLGKRVFIGFSAQTPRRIVGIVGNVRHNTLNDEPGPNIYLPYYQVPWSSSMSLIVRTSGSPLAALGPIREQIRGAIPDAPIYDVKPMAQVLSDSLAQPRFSTLLLVAFSLAALLLASVGIYGFINFLVAQRTHELGIRMALGAQRSDIFRLILGHALSLALAGVGVGLVASFALTRLLSSMLFGVSPTDPSTFFGISLILIAVVLAACCTPALRATRVGPMESLRCE